MFVVVVVVVGWGICTTARRWVGFSGGAGDGGILLVGEVCSPPTGRRRRRAGRLGTPTGPLLGFEDHLGRPRVAFRGGARHCTAGDDGILSQPPARYGAERRRRRLGARGRIARRL